MARDGQSTSADEPGGRASRFLGAVVAFVVAIFHPIFRVFASATANSPAHPSSHQSQEHQRSDENNHAAATVTTTTITTTTTTTTAKRSISSQRKYQDPNDSDLQADHNGEADSMHPQQQRRLAQSHGPKEVSANVRPAAAVKVTLPHINPPNGAVKKENVTANGVATLTNDNCELADATNGSKYRAVGEEQAEENRQEQLTLPPPIEPIDEQDDHEPEDPELTAERAIHHGFMSQALDMARLSLKTNETPVGCVLVHDGRVIARGMNATNITRNGTRHAELMALTALLSYTPNADIEEKPKKSKMTSKNKRPGSQQSNQPALKTYTEEEWGDVDPSDGHIYPYGQKLHPAPRVDREVIRESILYVTVEPCVMCASMLRQFGIKKVYFGAVNDKFGGTGGVFCIHMNSDPVHPSTAPATPAHRPVANQFSRPTIIHKPASCASSTNGSQEGPATNGSDVKSVNGIVFVEPPIPVSNTSMGHGGNVENGFEAEGGWGRDEAVNLLRQFYVQENGRAPVPRKKEGRAARLAAMMESQGMSTEGTALEGLLQQEREALSGENAGAEDANSATLAATLEAKLKPKLEKDEAKSPNTTAAEGTGPAEMPLREEATA